MEEKVMSVVNSKVLHMRKLGYASLEDFLAASPDHVYIGRDMSCYVRGAVGSKWRNPFKLKDHSIDEVLRLYEGHVRSRPDLMRALPELSGKTLACWCKPAPCHGDVLLRLVDEVATASQGS
jgi:hypothetical protein